jgi:glycosyltransferase involved in cell wall biosynthesis
MSATGPLVTVLTPVHNGEPYLQACLDSVLAQTYERWEHVVVDNASTDGTPAILARHAARDPRVRVVRNDRLVPVIENHNIALRHVAPASRWCKFVSADDMLFPDCLAQMVALGEAHPSVGLVSAYQMHGTRVGRGGLPAAMTVAPGAEVCRHSLLGCLRVFGNPTSHMLRADLVRGRDPFYDESNLHADEAACYEVLRTADVGFVHRILTYARVHDRTLTVSVARRLNTYLLGRMAILLRYGPVYLTPAEYAHVMAERLDAYHVFLARALLAPGGREIWAFHRDGLRALGIPISRARLLRTIGAQVARIALAPHTELAKVVRFLRPRDEDGLDWKYWWARTGFEPVAVTPGSGDGIPPAEAG